MGGRMTDDRRAAAAASTRIFNETGRKVSLFTGSKKEPLFNQYKAEEKDKIVRKKLGLLPDAAKNTVVSQSANTAPKGTLG